MDGFNKFDFTSGGHTLEGWLHPAGNGRVCVIISHGFGGYGDSPKWRFIADGLARAGMPALRFSHRGCGNSGGSFADTTLDSRAADVEAAMSALDERAGATVFALLGSSMGAATALVLASHPRVACSLTLAAPADFSFFPKMINNPAPNERGNIIVDGVEINAGVMDNMSAYDPVQLASRAKNLFIMHGDRDDLIPHTDADKLYAAAPHPKKIMIVHGADHPFSDTSHQQLLLEQSILWFSEHLASGGNDG